MARMFELTTPLAPDVLLFHALHGREELGRLSEFDLSALSLRADIAPGDLLGKSVTVSVELRDGGRRFFNGYVTRFAHGSMIGRYFQYRLTVRSWPWFLTRTADCRIFQNKTVPVILREVFADHPMAVFDDKSLTGKYAVREYCVQYRESDFNFVSRLMEEEGIYYHFDHSDGQHVMKLMDSNAAHPALEGSPSIAYYPPGRQVRVDTEYIHAWTFAQSIQPGAFALDDYDFKNPKALLGVAAKRLEKHDHADLEVFDYPGEYRVTSKDGGGEHYVDARIDELHSEFDRAEAECNVREIAVGRLFTLTNAPRKDQEREYLITGAWWELRDNAYESSLEEPATFHCQFTALHSLQQFRPARLTRRPIVRGPQTAVVVGPSSEEIWTDKEGHGRVKVLFHWDREGKKKNDGDSSCWIRVSQPWAGQKWGAIAIPRIGQEVIVDFLEGDPDQPIVTGRVYNADQMPPYDLPANNTQTGIKSRSSRKGTPENYNELQFEDKKGEEKINLHAEKDYNIRVEHDMSTTVDHDDSQTVHNNRSITVHGTHNETITKDTSITISKGPYRLDVQNNTFTHHTNGKVVEWFDSTQETYVFNDILIKSNNAKITINAKEEIFLVCGDSSMSMKKDGTITISGKDIQILGGKTVKAGVGNQNVEFNTQKVQTSGAAINSSAVGMHEISGALVKIN